MKVLRFCSFVVFFFFFAVAAPAQIFIRPEPAGKRRPLQAHWFSGHIGTGAFYHIAFETGETPAWSGIGVGIHRTGGDRELWMAAGPDGAVSLGIYTIQGGSLSRTWLPINAAEDKSIFGFENLTDSPQLGGVYKIISAKCYRIRWATGTTGLGFATNDPLAMTAGWGADFKILRLKVESSAIAGDFLGKSSDKGFYSLTK